MNIKKQLKLIFTLDFLGSFNLTDTVWMLLLVARGFTLWEAGIAEGVFHLVSCCCEIPSGMLADVFGRRRVMVASWAAFVCASAMMLYSNTLLGVCVAMGLNALGYNLSSGTREALTYDSLLEAEREEEYLKISSWQNVIWRGTSAVCRLMAGVALRLGYRICYGLHLCTSVVGGVIAAALQEAKPGGEQDDAVPKPKNLWQLPQAMMKQTKETLHFLRQTPLACLYMLAASGLGGFITLTGFFVQQHLVEHGAGGTALLGPILFGISLGGVAGAKLAIPLAKLRHRNAVLICGILSAAGVALCSSPLPAVCVAGGFFMMICDEALCTLTDARLNQLFPSAQRATLVSVFSMSFSLVMVVLSPLVGAWCGLWGTGVAFALCAGVMLAATLAGRLWVGYLLK